ncbi:MAG: efflux RND transporter periplasmic adaptor subunit [Ideonella sp.]|jgi:RND family efflux transporter MFP subunit|nr:efflux RND transporter periplasmic adaptor subunit [Ideonella sp.]
MRSLVRALPAFMNRPAQRRALSALAAAAGLAVISVMPMATSPASAEGATAPTNTALATFKVQDQAAATTLGFDGVVEAVRHTVMAAQVAGAVVQLEVKAGDRVKAGQLLMRLDARAANQSAAASTAQVEAARAQLDVATRDVQRQRQLFEQQFISRAALDRAEAEFRAAQAQVEALRAQAGVATTQTAFHVVRAPYAGVVADVPVTLGDMALPGRPLVAVYDPGALRVTAAVPQSLMARLGSAPSPSTVRLDLGATATGLTPTRVTALPVIDAATHTATLRADLPSGLPVVVPGQFARAWIDVPADTAAGGRGSSVRVPASALVRRAEMTALYVIDSRGKPLLRQVRLGRTDGDQVEVLTGLSAGETVAADPQAAARIR